MKVGPPNGRLLPEPNPLSSFLRRGDTVEVFIESRTGGLLSARIGQHVFPARARGDVVVGQWYRVRITGLGRIATLRILERQTAAVEPSGLSRQHGLPDADAQVVVRAFIRSGLPLNTERLALAWRRVRSASRADVNERARLAAILEEKGLLDSASLWERGLEALCGGSDNGERHHSARDRQHGQDSHAELADEIAETLRGREEADDPLQLINHRHSRDHHWCIVPLAFEGAPGFSASLRIRMDSSDGAPTTADRFATAVLDVRARDERWTFGLIAHEEGVRAVVLGVPDAGVRRPPPAALEELFAPLRARLERLGVPFRLKLVSAESNDGFATDDETTILHQVDSSV